MPVDDQPSLLEVGPANISRIEPDKAEMDVIALKMAATNTSMPPRMAHKRKSAFDWANEIKRCPKGVQKEFARLNALVAKLTGSKDKAKPKVLYFDENWLATRWGMSVKHIRNLRAAGGGPKVTYFGRSVRYRLREVIAFEKANAFASPTDRDQSR